MKKLVSIAVLSLLSFVVFQALDIPQNTLNVEDAVASHGGTCGGYAQDGPYGCFCTNDTMVCNDGSTSGRHLPYCYFDCGSSPSTPSGPTISATASCSGTQPRVTVSWSSYWLYTYDVHRCTGASCTPTTKVAEVGGSPYVDTSITSGTAYSYRVRGWWSYFMTGYKNYTSYSNTVSVTAPTCSAPSAPTADLRIARCDSATSPTCATSLSDWGDANITDLGLTEEVVLTWTSTNASSCSGSSFSTNTGAFNTTSGTQYTVTEPSAGNTTTYILSCTNGSQTATDSISVTRVDEGSDDPIISVSENPVDSGESTVLSWNTASCAAEETTITADKDGTGLPDSYASALPSTTGDVTLEITETTTFTISCSTGSTTIVVRAIPIFFET